MRSSMTWASSPAGCFVAVVHEYCQSRRDAPDAVIMSLDTFNGLMETVHLLKSPANAAHLARSVEQYRRGQVLKQDLVDAD